LNINARYTGIDISPPMIDTARQLHPDGDFRLLDILDAPPKEHWDWVFLIGAFNAAPAFEGWWEYVQQMMRRMSDLCIRGMAADFLSSYVDFKKSGAFHADPEQVFSFGRTLTRRVALRHDYMAYEFMIYLYKDQRLTDNNVFIDFKSTPSIRS
jgi:trans-aconitate methyltransferase